MKGKKRFLADKKGCRLRKKKEGSLGCGVSKSQKLLLKGESIYLETLPEKKEIESGRNETNERGNTLA